MIVADSWRNACWAAGQVARRLVEQAHIRVVLNRRYLLFATFQAARTAVPSHRFRCLREIHVPAQWCCFACSSFGWCTGWGYFSLVFCWAVLLGLVLLWVVVLCQSPEQCVMAASSHARAGLMSTCVAQENVCDRVFVAKRENSAICEPDFVLKVPEAKEVIFNTSFPAQQQHKNDMR